MGGYNQFLRKISSNYADSRKNEFGFDADGAAERRALECTALAYFGTHWLGNPHPTDFN